MVYAGLRIAAILFLTVFMVACGGGGDSSGKSVDSGVGAPFTDPEGADLSGVSLAQTGAAPMEWVEVLGLPEGVGQSDVHIKYLPAALDENPWSSDEALIMPLYVEIADDSDRVFLAAPLFELEGSAAKMVVSDGKSHSGLLNLDLLPLPARRAGAIDELTVALEDLLKAGTEALGKDYPEEWEGWRDQSYNQIPEYLLPLALFWHETANRDNPNALVNRSFDAEERELLERILAHRSRQGNLFVETVENLAQATRDGNTLLDEAAAATPVMTSSSPLLNSQKIVSQSQIRMAASSTLPIQELNGQAFAPINSPEALARLLQAFKDAREFSEDIEMATDIADIGVTVVTVASTGGAGGLARAGASLTGKSVTRRATAFVVTSAARLAGFSQVAQWFLPCCIPDMQVELDPADGRIPSEDEVANQIRLVKATGRAESAGVNLVQKAFDQVVGSVQGQFDEVAGNTIDALADSSIPSELISSPTEPLFQEISSRLPEGANIVLVWEDIDLAGSEPQRWLNHEVDTFASGEASAIIEQANTSSQSYEFRLRTPEAFDRQASLLRFRTDPAQLPAPEAIATRQISLEYIDIEFAPSVIRVDDDTPDVTPVTMTVTGANDTNVELPLQLDPDFGTLVQTGTGENGVYTFDYIKPAGELPDGIATVNATSTAKTGIRADFNDPPPRTANLLISPLPERVEVSPGSACLGAGETQQFQARDPVTGEPVEVSWSADRGSINTGGLYTAPGGDGPDTVTASTENNSSSAQITVADCSCTFTASLSGPGVSAADRYAGAQGGLVLSLSESGYDGISFFGDGASTALIWNFDTPLPFGATGPASTSIRAPVASTLNGEGFSSTDLLSGASLPALDVSISERQLLGFGAPNAVSMAGTISGTVSVPDFAEGESINAALSIEFSGLFTFSPPSLTPTLNCDNISF